jgi:cell division protein FtsW
MRSEADQTRRTTKIAKDTSSRGTSTTSTNWLGADFSNGYYLLMALVAVLCTFGLMMVLSSSSVDALRDYGSSWVFFKRQVLWLAVSVVVLVSVLRLDYRIWRKWGVLISLVSIALLVFVLVPGVGVSVSGARRWLGRGSFTMQPSEIAKFGILIFSADLLTRREKLLDDWRQTIVPVSAVFVVLAALIMLQPDMGTTMVVAFITAVLLFVGGVPVKYMARIAGVIAGLGVVAAIAEPYRRARLTSFLHPFNDASGSGYQVAQSLIGIGTGGITGVGLGASRSKWGFLPNAHTDFIFAIIAEELGLIGAVVTVGFFIAFAVLGVRAATRAPDRFGMLLASGITAWVVFQAFLNIGAVIGILPVTGVPLPFLSQGGSSLVLLMAATGVLLNIARQGEGGQRPARKVAPKTKGAGRILRHSH